MNKQIATNKVQSALVDLHRLRGFDHISVAPLVVFRMLFGVMMLGSIIRFWANGWIELLYLEPTFFFSYPGFAWVKPIGSWTYGIFCLCGLSALGFALGYRYRLSATLFFLSFTYIELMDKTTYLNHYYFVSVVSFVMIFLPAHVSWSIDAWQDQSLRSSTVPAWTINSIKLLLGIVYVYAGLAKLNSDWLLHAQPLATWLPANTHLPLIGPLMSQTWVHYAFSWFGAIYDLTIPFFLLYKPTRPYAFFFVVVFHVMTRVLFPIGMFPFIMIFSTLIFADATFHERLLAKLVSLFKLDATRFLQAGPYQSSLTWRSISRRVVGVVMLIQLILPFRYVTYPGELFWTEEGFRFSWRVMLMEKAGYVQFKVVEPQTGKARYVDNAEFLTPFQEKQMSFQPDFILEYAHFLADEYGKRGIQAPEVYVESYVGLNGRSSQQFVRPDVNLLTIQASDPRINWLTPLSDEISGL